MPSTKSGKDKEFEQNHFRFFFIFRFFFQIEYFMSVVFECCTHIHSFTFVVVLFCRFGCKCFCCVSVLHRTVQPIMSNVQTMFVCVCDVRLLCFVLLLSVMMTLFTKRTEWIYQLLLLLLLLMVWLYMSFGILTFCLHHTHAHVFAISEHRIGVRCFMQRERGAMNEATKMFESKALTNSQTPSYIYYIFSYDHHLPTVEKCTEYARKPIE